MKKIALLTLIILCFIKLNAQTNDIRITNYAGYSVGTPHFGIMGDSVFMTFDTNFPYIEFPVSGPSVPYTIGMVSTPPQSYGPTHAEVGVMGKYKSLAYIDWNSSLQKYYCFETHTDDHGLNWSTPQILDTISKGNSVPTNNLNPLIKSTASSFYYINQSYLFPRIGMIKVSKASPPLFNVTDVFFPLDTSLGADLEPFDYEVSGDGPTTIHSLAYFKEGESSLYFVKSTDDGKSYSSPSAVWKVDPSKFMFTNPLDLDLSTDTKGNVVVAFTIYLEDKNFHSSNRLFMAISKDFGNTWSVDSIPGLANYGITKPKTGIRSNNQQVVMFLDNGYVEALSTEDLKSFSVIDTLTDMATANNFYALVKNDFLYVAWEDNRFGFGMEEIYYDTMFAKIAPAPTSLIENTNLSGEVGISPNPFSNQTNINIQGDIGEKYDISIIDMYGRTLRKYVEIPSGTFTLERENLNFGTYVVRITNKNNHNSKLKIMIVN